MAYATRDDLVLRFGETEMVNLEAMQTDPNAVTHAIQDATEEIDSYIAVRYTLPISNVPSTLKRVACNIARYRLYFQQPTEEVENRYKDEVKYLQRLADGKAILSILEAQTQVISSEKPKQNPSTLPIGSSYKGGIFSDATLGQMPSIDH